MYHILYDFTTKFAGHLTTRHFLQQMNYLCNIKIQQKEAEEEQEEGKEEDEEERRKKRSKRKMQLLLELSLIVLICTSLVFSCSRASSFLLNK